MSKRKLNSRHAALAVTLACTIAIAEFCLVSCTGKGGSSDNSSNGVAVSGVLSQATVADVGNDVFRYEAASAVTNTTVSLDCGSRGSFTGVVDPSTGAFSVAGLPTGVPCSFNFVNTTTGVTKCQVQFQDSSNYDLNHKPMSTNSATATSGVSLGAITCDSSGTILIPANSIANVNTGSTIPFSLAYDFTGTYTVGVYDGALPTGYVTPVAGCTNNCGGPSVGDVITLVRFHGKKFTPNSGQCTPSINVVCPASSGTTDAAQEGYGMSIWGGDYANGVGACGARSGFTLDEARAYAGLDLDATAPTIANHQLSYGHYIWSVPTGFGGDTGWTKPWMRTNARSNYPVQDCQPVTVPSTAGGASRPGQACFTQTVTGGTPTGLYIWNVGLQNAGGCLGVNGAPLMVNNWASISYGTCSNTVSAFNSNMTTSSCQYTGSPIAGSPSQTFTCSWTGGNFTDVSGGTSVSSSNGPNFNAPYAMPANTWNGQPATLIAQNGTCAGSTSEATLIAATSGGSPATRAVASKELLARYRCYANTYWQNSSNGAGSTSCSRNYNFDWSTDNFANFVTGDDRSMKPQNAFITDRIFYSPDGQWIFLKNRDTQFQSIPTASGSTLCPLDNLTELKVNRINDQKFLVNLVQKSVMADRSTACQAAVSAALEGGGNLNPDPTNLNNLYKQLQTQRVLFYLNR